MCLKVFNKRALIKHMLTDYLSFYKNSKILEIETGKYTEIPNHPPSIISHCLYSVKI